MCGQCLQEARYLTRDAVRSHEVPETSSDCSDIEWGATQWTWTTFNSVVPISSSDPIFSHLRTLSFDLFGYMLISITSIIRSSPLRHIFLVSSLSSYNLSIKMKFGRVKVPSSSSQNHSQDTTPKKICVCISSGSLSFTHYVPILRALSRTRRCDLWVIDSIILGDDKRSVDLLKMSDTAINESAILRQCVESFLSNLQLAYPAAVASSHGSSSSGSVRADYDLCLLGSSALGPVFTTMRHAFHRAVLLRTAPDQSLRDAPPQAVSPNPTYESSSPERQVVLPRVTESLWASIHHALRLARGILWAMLGSDFVSGSKHAFSAEAASTGGSRVKVSDLTENPDVLLIDADSSGGLSEESLRRIRRFIDRDNDSSDTDDIGESADEVAALDSYVECKPCWQPLPRRNRNKKN